MAKRVFMAPNFSQKINIDGNAARDYVCESINKAFGRRLLPWAHYEKALEKFGYKGMGTVDKKVMYKFIKELVIFFEEWLANQENK